MVTKKMLACRQMHAPRGAVACVQSEVECRSCHHGWLKSLEAHIHQRQLAEVQCEQICDPESATAKLFARTSNVPYSDINIYLPKVAHHCLLCKLEIISGELISG